MQSPEFLDRMDAKYAAVDARWDPLRSVFTVGMTDTHFIDVMPLIFTAAVITTPKRNLNVIDDRWCYHSIAAALAAAEAWDPEKDPEPSGWHRHPATGRRRPDGRAEAEYVLL